MHEEIEGVWQYSKVLVVCRTEHQLGLGTLQDRKYFPTEINMEDLQDVIPIPKDAYQPLATASITRAPKQLPDDCHIKRPNVSSYDLIRLSDQPNQIAQWVMQEVDIYEILKHHPHPNIVHYLGCEIDEEDYVSGIWLTKYPESSLQRVNPGSFNKRALKFDPATLKDRRKVLDGVESGIRHLHSFGLAHNDINPANIMLFEDDTPVIIDFGSCRRDGESTKEAGGTYEWYDEEREASSPRNDLDALAEIAEWLSGKEEKSFLYPA
ncbi:kinase-like protein [Aulographum hederae CBS 113979]|uniref:Kinase-like protein n=1 Tax=Aulographum hederae CBS 113979 TaxID=1176131 RepID=A0A6G1GMQ5_9PEZI|nr:kinase-like protein [Aulographum hederae CBS 113979]